MVTRLSEDDGDGVDDADRFVDLKEN